MHVSSKTRKEIKRKGAKALAVFLAFVLAAQSVNLPAVVAVANTAATDALAQVTDTPATGAETTDEQSAAPTDQTAPAADATAPTEEPATPVADETPVDQPADQTASTGTDAATGTDQAAPANPADNAAAGATTDGSAPATPAADTTATVSLSLTQSTLTVGENTYTPDNKTFDTPANHELKFTVAPADGFAVSAVKQQTASGVETNLTANEAGEYTVAATDVADGLKLTVETAEVPAEPAEDPAEDPAAPAEDKPADDATTDETADDATTDEATDGEKAADVEASVTEIAEGVVNAAASGISISADPTAEVAVPVTVRKTDQPDYSMTVDLPLGVITAESAAAAVAGIEGLEDYEYRDTRVDNVVVISLNQHNDTYYVTTDAGQIAGIALGSTTEVVLYFQPEGSTYHVNYKVMLGNDEVTGDNIPGDLIGPETVNKGEDLSMSFVPDYGFEIEGVTVSDGLQADSSSGVYLIGSVNDTDGDRTITVTVSVKEIDSYDIVFGGSNTDFVFQGDEFSSNRGTDTSKTYSPSQSIGFTVKGNNEWGSQEQDKDFSKLVIYFDGVAYAIGIPMGRNNSATTELADLGYTVTVERTSRYDATFPQFSVTITAANGKVRGDITIETNFKDRSNSEVWANVLVGVESLFTDNNSSNDAGDGYLTTGAGTQKYAVRDTDDASNITIKIADGYDSNATPQLTIVVDGQEVANPEETFNLRPSGSDWVFTLPNDRDFRQLGYNEPKDIRISVTIPSLERTYGAKFEGEDYDTQTKTETWSVNDTFAVSDNTGVVPERNGFVFQGWTLKGDSSGTVYKNGAPFSINDDVINYAERGENDVYYFTFVAQWVEADEADQVPYNINLYFANEDGEYGEEPSRTIQENGVPKKTAFIDADTLTQTLTELGYIPDGDWIADDSKNDYSVYVTTDEVASIKIYYQRAVSVTFEPGDEGAASDQQSKTVKIAINTSLNEFDETVPEFAAEDGWAFAGWSADKGKTILSNDQVENAEQTKNITYVAQWTHTGTQIQLEVNKDGSPAPADEYVELGNYKDNTQGFKTSYSAETLKYTIDYTYESLNCADISVTVNIPAGYDARVTSSSQLTTTSEDGKESATYKVIHEDGSNVWNLDNVSGGSLITVELVQKTIEVAYVADPAEGGHVDNASDSIEVVTGDGVEGSTATPNEGYKFAGWYVGETLVTTEDQDPEGGYELTADEAKNALLKNADGTYAATTFTAKFNKLYQVTYEWTGLPEGATFYDAEGAALDPQPAEPAEQPAEPADITGLVDGQHYDIDTTYAAGTTVYTVDDYGNVLNAYVFSGWDKQSGEIAGANVEAKGEWTTDGEDLRDSS